MARNPKQIKKKKVEQYEHKGKRRLNNPPVGLVNPQTDQDAPKNKYKYDPHLDPQLIWSGKVEHTSFQVPTVSLHVHERIDPRTIIEAVRKKNGNGQQQFFFSFMDENPPLREAVEFYKHKHNWSNRMIAGDSLLVMNSLLEKEGMSDKVQMVYMDPPYGIKYGSNFQPFVNKRDVKDGKDEDLTSEPETIKAFRDTWELGIHSYLTYMRDRLLLAKKLLHESGSVFVQISDENVHHVRELMDEVFGVGNFVQEIPFRKTVGATTTLLATVNDYLIWYAKDKAKIKFRKLYRNKDIETTDKKFQWYEIKNNELISLENYDGKVESSKVVALDDLTSQEATRTGSFKIVFQNQEFLPANNRHWRTTEEGIKTLISKNRLYARNGKIFYKRYLSDQLVSELNNFWFDTVNSFEQKMYVVQTNQLIIQRCILMTTDPGDLVFDPTCGSGTTAYVAEQWGRRWITCDTSRVAITLAKQRLMTSLFDYYQLAHPNEGVGSGFVYKTVPHITLKSIANNEPPAHEALYDRPSIDNSKARVTGPFTVEAVPSPVVKEVFSGEFLVFSENTQNSKLKTENSKEVFSSKFLVSSNDTQNSKLKTENLADSSIARSGETLRQSEWRDELLNNGVRGKGGQYLQFSRVEPLAGTRYIQAEAETLEVFSSKFLVSSNDTQNSKLKTENSKKVFIVFGPEHAPMEQRQVALALDEAQSLRPKAGVILFVAFQFDPEAAKDIDEMNWPGVTLLRVQMNADLFTEDLKKKRTSDDSFWLLGQPDIRVFSGEFLVFSEGNHTKNSKLKTENSKEVLCEYETFKKLSGLNSLEEINKLGREDLFFYALLSQGRDIWNYLSDAQGWNFNTGQYCGRTSQKQQKGVPQLSWNCQRLACGIRDFNNSLKEFGISNERECRNAIDKLRRNSETAGRLATLSQNLNFPAKNSKLTTKNYHQVEVKGFDYYDTKTGNVISGNDKNIAVWMLDPDYDGRSLFPRQVFFPMSSDTEGWSKLAKNLKAEIDQELIESYRGTVSLPFSAGEYKQCAVKIIDDRGTESLRIIKL